MVLQKRYANKSVWHHGCPSAAVYKIKAIWEFGGGSPIAVNTQEV
jgi:hypothetical protein